MTEKRETVFLVDDDDAVRRGLARLLHSAGFRVQQFPNAEAVLEDLAPDASGCLLLDLELGGLSGIQLQERLAEQGRELPIVFLTGRASIPESVRAMRSGAVDFLEKPADEGSLLAAVRAGLARQADLLEARRNTGRWRQSAEALTAREREILRWVIGGAPNKRTAYQLGIAEKTVKVHRARVMQKMQAASIADLVRMCDAIGIDPAESLGSAGSA